MKVNSIPIFKLEGDQFNTDLEYSYLDSCYSKFYNFITIMKTFITSNKF